MVASFRSMIAGNFPTAMALCLLFLFIGTMIAAKFDSKWGYVIMAGAVAVALFALRVKGVL